MILIADCSTRIMQKPLFNVKKFSLAHILIGAVKNKLYHPLGLIRFMIKSLSDYKFYLKADEIALGIHNDIKSRLFQRFINEIWQYERLLRKTEYYNNCKTSVWKMYALYLRWRLRKFGISLGYSIPINTFGAGLSIAHIGPIIVNGNARIGDNCRIDNCVQIGTRAGELHGAPTIGDNVFIGPGARIFGDIKIADDIAIGANSMVNKSFLDRGITIAGSPAKQISDKGSHGLLFPATQILKSTGKI